MSEQKVEAYISGNSSIDKCKRDLSQRMSNIKQRMDAIEAEQNKKEQTQIQSYFGKFKPDLKFILQQFETFQKAADKLCKQLYDKQQLSKQQIVTSIRQQIKRFHRLIPAHIEQQNMKQYRQLQQSRIKNIVSSSASSGSASDGEKQKQNVAIEQGNNKQMQFELILSDLNSVLDENKQQNKQMQTKDGEKLKQTTIKTANQQFNILQNLKDTNNIDQKEENRRTYLQYIQAQEKRKAKNPLKTVKKIIGCLLITVLIILFIIFYGLYKIFSALSSSL